MRGGYGGHAGGVLSAPPALAPFSCPVHSGAPLSIRLGPLPRAWAFGTVRLRGENEHCRSQPPLLDGNARRRREKCQVWVGGKLLARREEEVPRVDARTPASKASAMPFPLGAAEVIGPSQSPRRDHFGGQMPFLSNFISYYYLATRSAVLKGLLLAVRRGDAAVLPTLWT